MNTAEIKGMILYICDMEIKNKDELCRLDSFVGDGDHGYTVERGFLAVKNILLEKDYSFPKEILEDTGNILVESMGGAIGMIMGSLFLGGAFELDDKPEMNEKEFVEFLNAGLGEIKMVGGAKEGDRTLVDALSPAAAQFQKAEQRGENLKECFSLAAKAAREGSDSTKNMVAKKGRAKFLQEKSKGYVDAGSVTMALIVEAMKEYIEQMESTA